MCTYVSKNAIKIIEVNNGSRKRYFPLKSIHMLLRFKKCWFKKCWCISSSPNAVCWVPPQSTHPHLPLLNAPCSSAVSNSLLCLLYPCFCMPGVLQFRFLYLIWIPSNILTISLFFLISSIINSSQAGECKYCFPSLSQGQYMPIMALNCMYCNYWFMCLAVFLRS